MTRNSINGAHYKRGLIKNDKKCEWFRNIPGKHFADYSDVTIYSKGSFLPWECSPNGNKTPIQSIHMPNQRSPLAGLPSNVG